MISSLSHFGHRRFFASDYPHWEFDAPHVTLAKLPKDIREQILYKNAMELFGLPDPMKSENN